MYCDLCRKEQAVFFVRTSNGELHVCEACARRRGISTDGKKNGNEGKSNLTAIFSSILRAGAEETSGVCRRCGMSRMEVTKTGKVGCPHCYDVFSMEVAARLHAEGGVLSYNGAMPKNVRFPGTESYPEKQAGGAPEKAENKEPAVCENTVSSAEENPTAATTVSSAEEQQKTEEMPAAKKVRKSFKIIEISHAKADEAVADDRTSAEETPKRVYRRRKTAALS